MSLIKPCLVDSYLVELHRGIHDFTTDEIWLALYKEAATLDNSTTAYSATNESSGANYTAGGKQLTVTPGYPQLVGSLDLGRAVLLDFSDISWASVSIEVRAGLIYNKTKANRAIAVLDWGITQNPSAQTFDVVWPQPGINTSIIRLGA